MSTYENPTLYQVSPEMMNLSGAETRLFNALLAEWQRHLDSNIRNEAYYKGKVRPVCSRAKDPAELRKLSVVVGWGGKAVDVLAGRSVFQRFDGDAADELDDALGGVDMVTLYEQAVQSELTDSCAFLSVSKGLKGEPPVIVSAHSALDAVGIWDERRKRIKCGLVVNDIDVDATGRRVPTWVTMYTDDFTYSARKSGETWIAEKAENPLGRPLIEPLRYRPSLTRPFGRSRISPTIRSLIDRALLVGSRTEITATFYTWPMRYLLGVDRKTAQDMAQRKIEMYTDSMLLVTPNKNGDVPQLGQLSQMTMQPHIDHLEMLGKQFASEACLPLDEVGIVFDNPQSAEALQAAQHRLIVEAEHVNRLNGAALKQVGLMALAASRDTDLEAVRGEDLSVMFANPSRPSDAARADSLVKMNSALGSWFGESDVALEWLGFNADETKKLERARASAKAQAIIAQATQGTGLNVPGNPDVAIRTLVDEARGDD